MIQIDLFPETNLIKLDKIFMCIYERLGIIFHYFCTQLFLLSKIFAKVLFILCRIFICWENQFYLHQPISTGDGSMFLVLNYVQVL